MKKESSKGKAMPHYRHTQIRTTFLREKPEHTFKRILLLA